MKVFLLCLVFLTFFMFNKRNETNGIQKEEETQKRQAPVDKDVNLTQPMD